MKHIEENASKGVKSLARGTDVACRYFWEIGLPAIEKRFPAYIDRIAGGLAADGSDCAGNCGQFDDNSDWAPNFQIYLTEADHRAVGKDLQSLLDDLPAEYDDVRCNSSPFHRNRVFSIDGFFTEKTSNAENDGLSHAPRSNLDWLRIPEHRLFDLTHGLVFYDPLGEFTERRKGFAAYYPDDVWRKRICDAMSRCGLLGQQILPGAIDHSDYYTSEMVWWQFVEIAMRLGFLLNRRYAPDLKWLYRQFAMLPEPSAQVTDLLWNGQCDMLARPELVKRIAGVYCSKIAALGLAEPPNDDTGCTFAAIAQEISSSITDPNVAASPSTVLPLE
ncbi:MAG: DUF4037 domain-containing protein [Armatimonadetes bacterium]|nr:DUF4037 domain-containing protein [Armatimonadota bacterium]